MSAPVEVSVRRLIFHRNDYDRRMQARSMLLRLSAIARLVQSAAMNMDQILADLRSQRDAIDQAIAALDGTGGRGRGRRAGRRRRCSAGNARGAISIARTLNPHSASQIAFVPVPAPIWRLFGGVALIP